MRSLRIRLLLGTGAVVAFGLTLSSVIVYSFAASRLYRECDNALLGKAQVLAALTEYTEDGLEFDFVPSDFAEYSDDAQPQYFQLWRGPTTILGRSPSLREEDLTRIASTPASLSQGRFDAVVLPDGRTGRQVTWAFAPKTEIEVTADELSPRAEAAENSYVPSTEHAGQEDVTVSVAMATTDIERSLVWLGGLLTCVSGGSVLACLAGLGLVVRSVLAPLNRISSQIARINERTLDARLDLATVPDEIAPLVERLNMLIARLESAFDRERAFSSDVAHEMRTPLSGLRSTIEVCRAKPRSAREYQESLDTCHQICDQAQRMIEALLAISRVEGGREKIRTELVQLDDLLHECWEPLAESARSKGLCDRWQLVDPCDLEIDRDKLSVVIRNLLENAVAHSNQGGDVQISAQAQRGTVRLCVENSGNRLRTNQVAHVFERFWRGDVARADTGHHAGLGLSLAERLTELLGGHIHVEVDGARFRVRLEFPQPPTVQQSDPGAIASQASPG